MKSCKFKIFVLLGVLSIFFSCSKDDGKNGKQELKSDLQIGAYYFDGWGGENALADDPDEPWAADAPTFVSRRMIEEFPDREPIWGWRDDSLEIMQRQIDLAADNGLSFFAFCWYWHDDNQAINQEAILNDPKNTSLELYLKAKNNFRMKFCLLIANHEGFEINGAENWESVGNFLMPYLIHEQYLTVDGKPLIIIFKNDGTDEDGLAAMQGNARKEGLHGLAIAGNRYGSVWEGFTHSTHYAVAPGWNEGSEAHTYAELIQANKKNWIGSSERPYIPIVTSGWDKRPWEGPDGLNYYPGKPESWYYPDRTPEKFTEFLQSAVAWMDYHPNQTTKERIMIIYAWNELGEGGYIAPTLGDPEGEYLKAIRSVAMQ